MTAPVSDPSPHRPGIISEFLGKELSKFTIQPPEKGPTEDLKRLVAMMCVLAAVDHISARRGAEAEAHNKICETHTPQRQKLLGIAPKDVEEERHALREEIDRICRPVVSEYTRTAVDKLIRDGFLEPVSPRSYETRLRVAEARRADIANLRELCDSTVAHIGWTPRAADFIVERDDDPANGMCGIYSGRR